MLDTITRTLRHVNVKMGGCCEAWTSPRPRRSSSAEPPRTTRRQTMQPARAPAAESAFRSVAKSHRWTARLRAGLTNPKCRSRAISTALGCRDYRVASAGSWACDFAGTATLVGVFQPAITECPRVGGSSHLRLVGFESLRMSTRRCGFDNGSVSPGRASATPRGLQLRAHDTRRHRRGPS
jgi:hypothetical protein